MAFVLAMNLNLCYNNYIYKKLAGTYIIPGFRHINRRKKWQKPKRK